MKPDTLLASPLVLLLLTGCLVGATFPLGKLSSAAGVAPIAWAFLISAGSALVLGAASWAMRRAVPLDGRHLRYYTVAGIISYAVPNLLVFIVIPRLGAGFTSILFTLSPIVTLVFATVLRVRRPNLLGIAGIAVGFAGALLIVLSKGQIDRPADPAWMALAFLIPVALAAGNVYRSLDWPPGAAGLQLAIGTNTASAAALFAAALAWAGPAPLATIAAAPALALAQILASATMFAVFFRLQIVGGPVYLSQIGYVAAAVGLASGSWLLGESYGLLTWLGGAVVAAGVALTTLAQRTPAVGR